MKSVMFVRGLLAIMVLLALGALPGCGEKEQTQSKPATVSKEDVKKEAKEAYDATKAYTQEQMQAFRKQMETKLNEYGEKIDQLQAKAKKLSSSSGNAWEQLKSGIDAAMEDSQRGASGRPSGYRQNLSGQGCGR